MTCAAATAEPSAAALALAHLPPLREVIARHHLAAHRRLGQHFLLDLNLTRRIVRAAGAVQEGVVIEIGPGPGGLTRSLLEAGARVIAIEKDRRCIEALRELTEAAGGALTVIEGDATALDVRTLAPPPRRIVANLPYNVATPLLIGWLRNATDFASLTLMFQKEVADRLVARPGTAAYGRLSVIAQWRCEVHCAFGLDARAFTPPPKVASAVVTLTPRPLPLAEAEWGTLERVTAAAFGQRRKMLRASLRALGLDPAACGIEPTRRAEELDVEEFCRLARLLAATAATS
ncbi:MAG TPA: 16S rRNA (adenine(1518)-N(6)/adenine(1519)-N(6))-dimethyltransferase RsmA [Candidatus Defluviicoccus seviourii]|nr:16S rRNA (adenine(1518)-N(6)/adenine(1519)-N(6))-dimethyltransferase RsmA [Candidatus Defluviicoccus seviourii]